MTTLYLIRHAEAEGNVYRRLHGQYDSHITPNGRRQIVALAERFRQIPVDAVYASDLLRTRTTAEAIYLEKNLPLRLEPRFRELNCGVWEDLPFGYLSRFHPEENRNFSQHPRLWSAEGSETFFVYTDRFLAAMEAVARRHEGQTVAIFSHGMVMRGVQQRLFFPEVDDLPHSENTAVSKIVWENGTYRAEFLNDASHLPEEITTLGRQQWWRKGDHKDFNIWFCNPETVKAGPVVRLALRRDEVVGRLTLSLPEGDTACMEEIDLADERCQMPDAAAQFLGEAVSVARRAGKTWLLAGPGLTHAAVTEMLRRYGFAENRLAL